MKRNTKKGFTIVELIIVIAVIAVLAAVLIPTFSNLIQKANVAADTTLIRNLNTALAMDTSVSKHVTMTQALEATKANGFDVEKIVARATNNKIVWDSVNDCFAYSEKDKTDLTYIPDSKTDANVADYQLWTIVKGSTLDNQYSSYIAGTNVTGPITAKKGVDVGENKGIAEIEYTGENGQRQSVVIRTNGGKLTVNASTDHVEHYGLAREIVVNAVSETTYVEHGTVAKMTVAAEAKNVVIKSTAVVVQLDNKSNNVSVEGNGYVGALAEGSTSLKSGTLGGDTIQVGTYDKLQAMALASTLGITLDNKTIELTADIDLAGKVWTPFGFSTTAPFGGTIDGKGHAIKGLSAAGYTPSETITNETNRNSGPAYGFVCIAQNATIKNIRFVDVNIDIENGLAVGAVVGDARGESLTIDNVTVNGSVKAMDKVGGLVGLAGYNDSTNLKLTIKNSTNNANVIANCVDKYNRAGGFVGALGLEGMCSPVNFENCTNNGNVTVTGSKAKADVDDQRVTAGGFVGSVNGSGGKTMTATNCTNTGTITATNTKTGGTGTITGMNPGIKDDNENGWLQVDAIYSGYNGNGQQ